MKYFVDSALCTGHGRCYAVASKVYSPDDEGLNSDVGKTLEVPVGMEEDAREGARSCPESAIVIMEER